MIIIMIRGDRLKQLREKNGYTHEDLAARLGIGFSQVWRLEAGKLRGNAEVVAAAAKLFGVSADYLLGLSDDPAGNASELNDIEKAILAAVRRGDKLEAIHIITES